MCFTKILGNFDEFSDKSWFNTVAQQIEPFLADADTTHRKMATYFFDFFTSRLGCIKGS
jgi:hypothetical protein